MKKTFCMTLVLILTLFILTSCNSMSISNSKFEEISKYVTENSEKLAPENETQFYNYVSTGLSIGGVYYGYYYSIYPMKEGYTMKIQAVCRATGLTDRTIRYYIEEKIIFPDYSENYLGRRIFEFSQNDVKALNDIAVLRKFGYSVGEIREMLINPDMIPTITNSLKTKKQTTLQDEEMLLQKLSLLDLGEEYTVPKLAAFLSAPVEKNSLPPEDSSLTFTKFLHASLPIVLTALATWLPIGIAVYTAIRSVMRYSYPKIQSSCILLTAICLLPSFLTLLLPKLSHNRQLKFRVRIVLLILCVLSVPTSFVYASGTAAYSQTTSFYDYRNFDPGCLANQSGFFQDFFPIQPNYFVNERQPDGTYKKVCLDSDYYYYYCDDIDYTYDIYAAWPLDQVAFDREVVRVKALFQEQMDVYGYWEYQTVQTGSYQCLFLYHGDAPFTKVNDNYTYHVFAYDEENLNVRYILCDSLENGADQPYYLSLKW